jgi:2-polyprenyl-3-methyl-5-hydroxy-6-metoxy-1,4-benzoquinol methylase
VDGNVSQYEVDIDLANPNTSHTQIVELVGTRKRVLDIGCWTGDLGRVLRERGCHVSGLEVDPVAADKARDVLDEVVVADLNTTRPSELFEAGSFDVVVLADVLEHLLDPVAVLADASTLLSAGGQVVISIPNVTHGSVRLALLQGRWDYTETGLLDATHIKFFARPGLLEMFAGAGMVIETLRGTLADPLVVEVEVDADRLPPTAVEWVRHEPDALVYQFVAAARRAREGEDPHEAHSQLVLQPAVPEKDVRAIDRHTARLQAFRDEQHRMLTIRDHIIGLEAATATAQTKADRVHAQLVSAEKRLLRKDERIASMRKRMDQMQDELRQHGASPKSSRGLLRRSDPDT